jgi:peptide/nickel transport system ATP-binding protein
MSAAPLLSVQQLSVRSRVAGVERTLVDSVSFSLGSERVAIVGESGSGKSLTARALMGLLREPLTVSAEQLSFAGQDLRALSARDWARLRGSQLSLILQDPRYCLNPVLTVGAQLDEIVRRHQRLGSAARGERIARMLDDVGLSEHGRLLRSHPHQLSGGLGQRVMLAMMLINGPRLLIADEPTSALDGELARQVLELVTGLVRRGGLGLLLISHDLQRVAQYCDRVLVMYQGRIVDRCPADELATAQHPYTRALWSCRPTGRTHGTLLPVVDRSEIAAAVRP